jgi:hypothetical protein
MQDAVVVRLSAGTLWLPERPVSDRMPKFGRRGR